jgi:hypothetical protein
MPEPKVLLSVPHQRQQSDGDCLAACALYVNDPHCSEAPITVPRADFELAWLERDYYYAL